MSLLTSVGGGSNGLLLADPGLLVLHVPEELLQTQRVGQLLLAGGHGLLQGLVARHQGLLLLADVVGVKVASLLELTGLDGDAVNAVLKEGHGVDSRVVKNQVL